MKKGILTMSAVTAAAIVFGGCASRDSKDSNSPAATGQSREADYAKAGNHTGTPDIERAGNVENLTKETTQGVCIDYSIDSYEGLQDFGYDLFAQNIQNKNPVLSPVSAYLALSIAGSGAAGTTKEEFYNVLGAEMEVYSDDMMNNLPQDGELLSLSIANSAWIDDEFHVDENWLGTIHSLMNAEAFRADLSTKEAMDSMNAWISYKTNGMIDQMLEKPLDSWTRLVLFDTVYFKGRWEKPFEANNTHREDFYIDRALGITEQVDMMKQYQINLDYISSDFAEGVILPYKNNPEEGFEAYQSIEYREPQMALIVLKPTDGGDIREVYGQITGSTMKKMLSDRQNEIVNLKIPKFEVTFDRELNQSLVNMGLRTCFDIKQADFTNMGTTQSDGNLYISLVRQKAKIIVDEEGTEAAAVTEIDIRDGAGFSPESKDLFFNEPFLYMIMDMEREIPVFIGIMDNPKGE